MGIRFFCPKGHKLNVKSFLAGKTGFCPYCNARVDIPMKSTRESSRAKRAAGEPDDEPVDDIPLAQPVPVAQPTGENLGAAPVAMPVPSSTANPSVAMPTEDASADRAMPSTVEHPVLDPDAAPSAMPAATTQPETVESMPATQQPSSSEQATKPPTIETTSRDPDVIAEAPDAVWYVRPESGGQYGPASVDVMRQWLDEGRVAADSLVWREGWSDWRSAESTFPELRR